MMHWLKKIRASVANAISVFAHRPTFRYGFLLPMVRELNPDPDERMLLLAMEFTAHNCVAGDYLEFGVWKGRSFVKAFHMWDRLLRRKGHLLDMRFFAFDSFQGLPTITTPEDASTGEFKKGDYTFGRTAFEGTLRARGVAMDRVHIVPGWFNESLTPGTRQEHKLQGAAVIWIDCDLYQSTVPVLEFITDLMSDGTVIIFDDWYCFKGRPDRGEQKAFSEWLARNPGIRAAPWHSTSWKSQSFILYRT